MMQTPVNSLQNKLSRKASYALAHDDLVGLGCAPLCLPLPGDYPQWWEVWSAEPCWLGDLNGSSDDAFSAGWH